jgi:hypothetical protein
MFQLLKCQPGNGGFSCFLPFISTNEYNPRHDVEWRTDQQGTLSMKLKNILVLLLVFGTGCDNSSNTDLVLTPGIGIRGVIEIGMTDSQIKLPRRKIKIEKYKWFDDAWGKEVPSLGLSWEIEGKNTPIPTIGVMVASLQTEELALKDEKKNYKIERFTGKTEQGLSFEVDGGVTGEDVIRCYGKPKHIIPYAESLEKRRDDNRRLIQLRVAGESYYVFTKPDGKDGVFFYPGIIFALSSNRVYYVTIVPAVKVMASTRLAQSDIQPELNTQRVVTVNSLLQVYGKLTQKEVLVPPDFYYEEVVCPPDVPGSDEEKAKRIKAILAANDITLDEFCPKIVRVIRVRSVKYWKNLNRQFQKRGLLSTETVGRESSCGTNQMRNARESARIVAEMNGSSFLFETNGSYVVHLEYSSMGTILRKRLDSGTWQSIETNRLVMISNKLLFSPKLKYDSFAIEISTRESLEVWIQVADAMLRLSTNATYSVDDFREVCREKISQLPYESVEEETGAGSVFVLKKPMPRSDFEKFRSDLIRLKRVPEWWTVSCEWVEEGGKVRLIPEKSKEADFKLFYLPEPSISM